MSSDDRLERLGLAHLRNDPEALQKALDKILADGRAEEDAWRKKKAELLKQNAVATPPQADSQGGVEIPRGATVGGAAPKTLPQKSPSAPPPKTATAPPGKSASAPSAASVVKKPAAPEPPTQRKLELAYDAIGGGARDRSAKVVKAPPGKSVTTRSAAPPVSAADFAARMSALGAAEHVLALLPKLASLPEQMRILTLEALFGAQTLEEVKDIVAQTTAMLPG